MDIEENDIVFYCKSCHSLCIITDSSLASDDWDGTYCGKCMSTDIGFCTMDEWLAVEEKRKKKAAEIESQKR